jgi:hypothetical protein
LHSLYNNHYVLNKKKSQENEAYSYNIASQEAEIRRITVQSQPRQIFPLDLISKNPSKNRAGGEAQGEGPEFKPQYCKKKKN